MVRIKMIYFAQAREAAGTKSEEFKLNGQSSVRTALSKAFEAHPKTETAGKVDQDCAKRRNHPRRRSAEGGRPSRAPAPSRWRMRSIEI